MQSRSHRFKDNAAAALANPILQGNMRKAKSKFVDITSPDDDLPWGEVRKALADIGFAGWATAEVGGGDVKRLTTVREQMQKAFGI